MRTILLLNQDSERSISGPPASHTGATCAAWSLAATARGGERAVGPEGVHAGRHREGPEQEKDKVYKRLETMQETVTRLETEAKDRSRTSRRQPFAEADGEGGG